MSASSQSPPEQEKGTSLQQSHHPMKFASSWCLLNPVQGRETGRGPTKDPQNSEESKHTASEDRLSLFCLAWHKRHQLTKSCLKEWKRKLQLYQKQYQPHGIKRWDKKKVTERSCSLESLNWIFKSVVVVVYLVVFPRSDIQQLRRYSRVALAYPSPDVFNIQQDKYMADPTKRLMIILLLTWIVQGCFQLFLLKQNILSSVTLLDRCIAVFIKGWENWLEWMCEHDISLLDKWNGSAGYICDPSLHWLHSIWRRCSQVIERWPRKYGNVWTKQNSSLGQFRHLKEIAN